MNRRFRILLVDDEPAVREGIREDLARIEDCVVVGEAKDGLEALSAIRDLSPDIVFLDVQMPGLDGLGVVAELNPEDAPVLVFVTAHEEYALQAFDAHALDYLLKPFDKERFLHSLDRARRECQRRESDLSRPQLENLLEELRSERSPLERFVVKKDHRLKLISATDVESIESAGNYVHLHLPEGSHLLRESLSKLELQLDPRHFARIHRSTIVRIAAVEEIEALGSGDQLLRLQSGREVTLSRTHRRTFERALRIQE